MADFRPETTITLYAQCGVDDENQPYFTSEGAKMGWYAAHSPRSFTEYSYQRENREYIRVNAKAEALRQYDMLSFKNSDGRNVICRITAVEFINPNCTEITYEVDYMQTYMDVAKFGPCWVEREMVVNDWYGDEPSYNNLQPEGIETGPLTRTNIKSATDSASFKNFDLVIYSAYDISGEPNYNVKAESNYPSGLNRIVFAYSQYGNIAALNTMLQRYAEKGIDLRTAIAGVYVIPRDYSSAAFPFQRAFNVPKPTRSFQGYYVCNAKCFTSEFFRLEISNRRGNEQELKLENFTEVDAIPLVMESHAGGGSGGTLLYPLAYEGHPEDFGVIKYDDIQCPFTCDAFTAWISGNIGNVGSSVINSAAQGFISGSLVAGPQGGAAMAIANASASLMKVTDRAKDPAGIGGQVAGQVMELVLGNYGFSINWVHPYLQNLKCIDEYFGRFGYRTNLFKVPNINTRPKWNFVKTSNAVVRGPMPKRAQVYMEKLMNQGVTFWHLSPGEELTDFWEISQNLE